MIDFGNQGADAPCQVTAAGKGKLFVEDDDFKEFPAGPVLKTPPSNEGDTGWTPSLGRSHMLLGNYWTHRLEPMRCN